MSFPQNQTNGWFSGERVRNFGGHTPVAYQQHAAQHSQPQFSASAHLGGYRTDGPSAHDLELGGNAPFSSHLPPALKRGHSAYMPSHSTVPHGGYTFSHSSVQSIDAMQSQSIIPHNIYDRSMSMSTRKETSGSMHMNAAAYGGNTDLYERIDPGSPGGSTVASGVSYRSRSDDPNRRLTRDDFPGVVRMAEFRHDGSRVCPICKKLVKDRLERHLVTHAKPGSRGPLCPKCEKEFARQDSLRRHLYSSATCGYRAEDQENLEG